MMAEARQTALPPGYALEHFHIAEVLGQGGFGITYKAMDTRLQRIVAIKEYLPRQFACRGDDSTVMPRDDQDRETFAWGLKRFIDEARALARFRHPNIVAVMQFLEANGTAYLVMEYEEGRNLDAWLAMHPEGVAEDVLVDRILMPLLDGLEKVHDKGLLHRDIKPENVFMRRDGTPVLIDFGASRPHGSIATANPTSLISAGYSPFEQYGGAGRQGPWTDIYALAGTMYRVIAGQKPADAIARQQGEVLMRAVEAGRGRYSETFLSAIDRALALHPAERPQSSAEFRAMVRGDAIPHDRDSTYLQPWPARVAAKVWRGRGPFGWTPGAIGRRSGFLIIGVLALTVLLFSLGKFAWNDKVPAAVKADGRKSIAVLPFANRSVREEDAYFTDGMHDELLIQLSKIGSLKVISRTSVLQYRHSDLTIPEIAKQLGVATILEGAVQRAAGQVRITVQLIDAQRDEHLWADSYDRALSTDNLFAIQSDITREITRALEAALTNEERARIGNAPTDNLQAYQYYLKGRQLLPLRTVDALKEGRLYAERSLELDPQFAPALTLLADSLHLLHEYSGLPVDESLNPAMVLVKKALAIDPNLAEGYAVLGELHRHEGNADEAAAAFQRAIRLAPGDAQAYNWFALLRENEGHFEEQLELLQRAHELNPMVAVIHQNLAWALFEVGRDEEALAEYRMVAELHPTFALAWLNQSWMHSRRGESLEALRKLRRYQRLEPASRENVYICGVLTDLDAPEPAESCYSKWLAAYPQDARVLLLSSYRYLARGDIDKARQIIHQADALDDPDWPFWVAQDWPYTIAYESINVGDYELARQVLFRQEPNWLTAAQPQIEAHWRSGPIAAAAIMLNNGELQRAQNLLRAIAVQIGNRQRARGGNAYGYDDVTVYALLGEKERALSNLEEVAGTGYLTNWHALEHAPQYASIRDDPRFDQAMTVLRSKAHFDREQAKSEGLLDSP